MAGKRLEVGPRSRFVPTALAINKYKLSTTDIQYYTMTAMNAMTAVLATLRDNQCLLHNMTNVCLLFHCLNQCRNRYHSSRRVRLMAHKTAIVVFRVRSLVLANASPLVSSHSRSSSSYSTHNLCGFWVELRFRYSHCYYHRCCDVCRRRDQKRWRHAKQ